MGNSLEDRALLKSAPRKLTCAAVLTLLLLALALGLLLSSMALDDPYVTYRYARNVRSGQGLVYNADEHVLSTTAPLYALLLAVGALFTSNLPALSNWLSVLALFAGSCFLYLLCTHFGQRWTGWVAGALFISAPLLWLSLGFETSFYLALVLGALYFYFEDHPLLTAALLALAVMTRGDGILPAVVLGLHYVATRHRIPWRALGVYLTLCAPLFLYLTLTFGSPFPVTLAAKSAQARLGVTGFYAHTTCTQGLWVLARAYLQQSPLYLACALCALIGLVAAWRTQRWLWVVLGWAALSFGGYVVLGVAPYHWYYTPLIPALALLCGLGVDAMTRWVGSVVPLRAGRSAARIPAVIQVTAAAGLALLLLVPQFVSDAQIRQALLHPGRVPPSSPVYKVLPEAKVCIYRQVGDWLKANTPPDSLIGVTEVGVMGYYSERRMVDFLGLLRPQVMAALKRGDMAWALLYYQPDYVVLTRVNPLYSYDLSADEWFKLAYRPVQVFEDARFWGGPVTVYRRETPPAPRAQAGLIPTEAVPLHVRFGAGIELAAYTLDRQELHPGEILNVTLYWKALSSVNTDYTVFVHVLGQHELVAAQQDAYPCLGACPTRGWKPGDVVSDAHMLALPVTAFTPDQAQLEVGLYERTTGQRLTATSAQGQSLGDNVRFGALNLAPAHAGPIPNAMRVSLGDEIALVGYNVDTRLVEPGETIHLTLYWQALRPMGENYSVFTHLLDTQGERVTQADSWPQQGAAPTSGWQPGSTIRDEYDLKVPANAPLGVYTLSTGVYLAATGERLSVLDAGGQPQTDHLVLTQIRVAQ